MQSICRRCSNYNLGKCVLDLDKTNDKLNFCFSERYLHIDLETGEYGDPMNNEDIGIAIAYCKASKDYIMDYNNY